MKRVGLANVAATGPLQTRPKNSCYHQEKFYASSATLLYNGLS